MRDGSSKLLASAASVPACNGRERIQELVIQPCGDVATSVEDGRVGGHDPAPPVVAPNNTGYGKNRAPLPASPWWPHDTGSVPEVDPVYGEHPVNLLICRDFD